MRFPKVFWKELALCRTKSLFPCLGLVLRTRNTFLLPRKKSAKPSSAASPPGGVRDPIKVTPDYTVVGGHLRLEVAGELGLKKVPVRVVDGDPEYPEYLLIADNDERRAKRNKFLLEYWKKMGSKNLTPKSVKELAKEAGYNTEQEFYSSVKLNDLIPEFQQLVSQCKLSQTAARSLAFLLSEEQEQLLKTLGESGVCGLFGKGARGLKRELSFIRKEENGLGYC